MSVTLGSQHRSSDKKEGSLHLSNDAKKDGSGEGKDEMRDIEMEAMKTKSTMEGISLEKRPLRKSIKAFKEDRKKSIGKDLKTKTKTKKHRGKLSDNGKSGTTSDSDATNTNKKDPAEIVAATNKKERRLTYFTKVKSRDDPSENNRPGIKSANKPLPEVKETSTTKICKVAANNLIDSALEVCMERFYHKNGPQLVALELRNTWHRIMECYLQENIFRITEGLLSNKFTKDDMCLPLNCDIWSKGAIEIFPRSRRQSIMDPFIRDDESFSYGGKSTLVTTMFPGNLTRTITEDTVRTVRSADSREALPKVSSVMASSVVSEMNWAPRDENIPIFGTGEDDELEKFGQNPDSTHTLFRAPESQLMGTASDINTASRDYLLQKQRKSIQRRCKAMDMVLKDSILVEQQKRDPNQSISGKNDPQRYKCPRSEASVLDYIRINKFEPSTSFIKDGHQRKKSSVSIKMSEMNLRDRDQTLSNIFIDDKSPTGSNEQVNVKKSPTATVTKSESFPITKPQKKLWSFTSDEMRKVLNRKSEVGIEVVSIFQKDSFVEADKSREQLLMMKVENNKSGEKLPKPSLSQMLHM